MPAQPYRSAKTALTTVARVPVGRARGSKRFGTSVTVLVIDIDGSRFRTLVPKLSAETSEG